MPEQPQWGTVNLGVDVLQGHGEQSAAGMHDYMREHANARGKEQFNPGRNQELKLPPDIFRMQKNTEYNPYSPTGKINTAGMHERIKELLGEGKSRRESIAMARQELAKGYNGDAGTISKKDIYRAKYQAPSPRKQISPMTANVQEQPYM